MTVEVKAEATFVEKAEELETTTEMENVNVSEGPKGVEKSSSYREESNFLSDLNENEKKALIELKTKLEDAILNNTIFKKASKESQKKEKETEEDEAEGANDGEEVDENISIWGVPLLPSKGEDRTNVVLLKFLRARDFKVNEALEMLKKTLIWRKEFKTDSILDEDFGSDLSQAAYISGLDREGHPICYNIFGYFDDDEKKKKLQNLVKWRVHLMERGIQKLDFQPGGVTSLLQINDLNNSPGPTNKDVRIATKKIVALLQDNYPEFVAKNIFINVPFWYYAFQSIMSPFLTSRTKSKFVFARPAKVTETLLKYVPIHEIPTQYGGMKKEGDLEFYANETEPSETLINAGSTEIIEIPMLEVGKTTMWEVLVLNWDVKYKEEFVPTDESSYTVIVQKEKKINNTNDAPIHNTFKNQEAGKIVLTIHNCSSKNKKAFVRHKIQKICQ
ncbi:hypothetical protein LIER_29380 [Lithospermum erythrorhizon]|uniref:Patellin-4 n=1 Tax=Lithospermum erythrorhizon TaxID=34254 RepID=A0AAV3RIX8_LITER